MRGQRFYKALSCLMALVALCGTSAPGKDQKIKPEELVQKHIESIGTPEARSAVKTRFIAGSAEFAMIQGGQGQLGGKGNIISQGTKFRMGMAFPAPDYPGEQLAFDGNKATVGQLRPGQKSRLSDFVYTYDAILAEGLLAGALSTGWPMLDLAAKRPRLDYTGLKKVEGRQLHELRYRPAKGAKDLQITLYFEPETYRHVQSQYRLVVPETMGARPELSSAQTTTTYLLVESFGDFREVDGLTLPHSCRLHFTLSGAQQTFMAQWNFTVEQLTHNAPLEGNYFVVQ